jgi:hypothetical protein
MDAAQVSIATPWYASVAYNLVDGVEKCLVYAMLLRLLARQQHYTSLSQVRQTRDVVRGAEEVTPKNKGSIQST